MHDVRAAHRIRVQIERFSGNLSRCLPEVGQRLVREVLYGVQARGSVRLSEIARSLGERTALKKVIERLDRQLGRPGLRERVRKNLLREAAPFVGQDILLVIDPTDVTKPYTRKMQYLAEVRDGSKGQLASGYWCLTVVAVHRGTPGARELLKSAKTPSESPEPWRTASPSPVPHLEYHPGIVTLADSWHELRISGVGCGIPAWAARAPSGPESLSRSAAPRRRGWPLR